jgi:type I restriction enzyme, S subunit
MTLEQRSEVLENFVSLDKGKPPLRKPYDGADAELYLTPEYLRGRASAELVKPPPNAVRVIDGETIVLWDGSNAGEIFRAKRGILASTMSRVRTNGHFESEFFYYALKGWEDYLKGQTSGSGIPHVDKEILGKLTVLTCGKDEQFKIAEILSTVDRAIEQTVALFAKQLWIKTGLMQDLLTRGIDEQGNLRSEETHQFKDSALGRIPMEWDTNELGSYAFVTKLAGFEYTNYFDYQAGGDIIALRALNIKNERLNLNDIQRISRDVSNKLPRSKIFAGDILITYIGAYIGDLLRIEEDDKYHLAPNIAKIVAGKSLLPPFLEVFLRSAGVLRQIQKLTAVTATPSLTMTQIRKILVSVPKACDEQREISNRITGVSDALNSFESQLMKLRLLKTAMMQDLLTGEKRVTPLLEATVRN